MLVDGDTKGGRFRRSLFGKYLSVGIVKEDVLVIVQLEEDFEVKTVFHILLKLTGIIETQVVLYLQDLEHYRLFD